MAERERKLHHLRIETEYAEAIWTRLKRFEVRSLKHGIRRGDLIEFHEEGLHAIHKLDGVMFEVDYVLTDERFCKPGYGIYGITPRLTLERSGDGS